MARCALAATGVAPPGDAWTRRGAQASRQITTLLDRIVEAGTPSVIAAYEKRIADLERAKLLLAEKTTLPFKAIREGKQNGGEGGIRTPDTVARMPHFECGAFNHSATSPGASEACFAAATAR